MRVWTTVVFTDYVIVDVNLPTSSTSTEEEFLADDKTDDDTAENANDDESDSFPVEPIKNIAACVDKFSIIRQFLCGCVHACVCADSQIQQNY